MEIWATEGIRSCQTAPVLLGPPFKSVTYTTEPSHDGCEAMGVDNGAPCQRSPVIPP